MPGKKVVQAATLEEEYRRVFGTKKLPHTFGAQPLETEPVFRHFSPKRSASPELATATAPSLTPRGAQPFEEEPVFRGFSPRRSASPEPVATATLRASPTRQPQALPEPTTATLRASPTRQQHASPFTFTSAAKAPMPTPADEDLYNGKNPGLYKAMIGGDAPRDFDLCEIIRTNRPDITLSDLVYVFETIYGINHPLTTAAIQKRMNNWK